ncbi:MAG: glycosyltransferase family 2 protein [Lawsonibacter sp.]|jgi:glycosyltransferase involved in cell wall biosynthesis
MSETVKQGLVSVVLPAFNEEASIPRAADTITALLDHAEIPYELIFVDDGSRDKSWATIQHLSQLRPQIRGVRFSRNFGKEAAIFAGLAQASGRCVVVLDCDLQHPPEKIVEMYRLWQQGYQVVEGVKTNRGKENPLHTAAARSFYSMISHATGVDMSRASDFKLLDRRAVDTLLAMREKNAFFRALSSWIGFPTAQVEFEVQPRLEGQSKWSLRSLVRYAVTNIASFSTAPLQLVTLMGVVVFICSVVLAIQSLWQKFTGHALEGFTTVILLQLVLGSILMICLGIIGYYIAKIYEEIKDRPRYIVADCCGEAPNERKMDETP